MQLGAARGVRLKKSLPWIVFFGVLLLLVFSNSPYVKMFDFVPWPVRFGILAAFFYSPGWVQVETSPRRRSKPQCRLARCGRPFPFFRGALVPPRFGAVKVSSTPGPPVFLRSDVYLGSARVRGPPSFREWELLCVGVRLSLLLGKVGSLNTRLTAALRQHSF